MTFGVRRLVPADNGELRAIRLRSLQAAPGAYGSTYERETAFADEVWADRLRPGRNPHFAYGSPGCAPVGIVAVGRTGVDGGVDGGADGGVAHLVGMWVDPEARGAGAADALVGACVGWATAAGYASLTLHVVAGNALAERVYERNGFRRTGATFARPRDGAVEIEMELVLRDS